MYGYNPRLSLPRQRQIIKAGVRVRGWLLIILAFNVRSRIFHLFRDVIGSNIY